MAKNDPKKKNTRSSSKEPMSLEQKLALLKVICVVGAGLLASLVLWLISK